MTLALEQNIFENHLLQPHSLSPANAGSELIWPSVFLIFCLILLAVIKLRASSKVLRIVQSTFSKQALQQMERDEFNPLKLSSLVLNLFFALNLAFLLYKINSIYSLILTEKAQLLQFFFFLFIVFILYGFKLLINFLLGTITSQKKIIIEYGTNSSLINQTFGLLIFPCIVLSEFSKFNPLIFVCCACVIIITAILIKWYRGLIIGLVEERIGLLQIFSYFCGLEILPVFVLVKFIIETF